MNSPVFATEGEKQLPRERRRSTLSPARTAEGAAAQAAAPANVTEINALKVWILLHRDRFNAGSIARRMSPVFSGRCDLPEQKNKDALWSLPASLVEETQIASIDTNEAKENIA